MRISEIIRNSRKKFNRYYYLKAVERNKDKYESLAKMRIKKDKKLDFVKDDPASRSKDMGNLHTIF